jgi:hypothetical protein
MPSSIYFIEKTIEWCRGLFLINSEYVIDYKRIELEDCWGVTEMLNDTSFMISIHPNMCVRDTIATVIHEMLHVKQWVHAAKRDSWDDGEQESESLQYKLTDLMWSLGLI